MNAPVLHLSIPVRDLSEAREFYEAGLGCEVGRVRSDWLDVWFFGMQLTLQHRPDEVLSSDAQGVRHFGVSLPDASTLEQVIARLRAHGVEFIVEPTLGAEPELSRKVAAKFADPSGNVIEIKYYDDPKGIRRT